MTALHAGHAIVKQLFTVIGGLRLRFINYTLAPPRGRCAHSTDLMDQKLSVIITDYQGYPHDGVTNAFGSG